VNGTAAGPGRGDRVGEHGDDGDGDGEEVRGGGGQGADPAVRAKRSRGPAGAGCAAEAARSPRNRSKRSTAASCSTRRGSILAGGSPQRKMVVEDSRDQKIFFFCRQ